jgi:hypothetical protein
MSVLTAIETLQAYPQNSSKEFRDQLEIVDKIKSQQDPEGAGRFSIEKPDRGIDRAQAFRPIPRPSLTRTAVR